MRQWACRRLQRAVLGEGRETHNEHR
jgi:hypothetical protein